MSRSRRVREPLQKAAVGIDQPDVIFAAAVGLEGNTAAIRGPAGIAVLVDIVSELPKSRSIRLDNKEVVLPAFVMEDQPLAVRREIRIPGLAGPLSNPMSLRRGAFLDGVEVNLLEIRCGE